MQIEYYEYQMMAYESQMMAYESQLLVTATASAHDFTVTPSQHSWCRKHHQTSILFNLPYRQTCMNAPLLKTADTSPCPVFHKRRPLGALP